MAGVQGAEHRALDLRETLFAIGVARNMPRPSMVSLAEQARMHAGRFRPEVCRALAQRIDEIFAREEGIHAPEWNRVVELQRATVQANAAIAAHDWRAARAELERAASVAEGLKLGLAAIENLALRAFVLDRNSEQGRDLMREAMDLGEETVKWHLKNLFGKLDPANRKHVVRRAQVLGLLEGAE